MRLSVQDQRIDGASDIVNRRIADDLHLARVGIDFYFAYLGTVREAGDRERLVGDSGEWPLQILWQVLARDRGRRDLEDADLVIGAGDDSAAIPGLGCVEDARSGSAGEPRIEGGRPGTLTRV